MKLEQFHVAYMIIQKIDEKYEGSISEHIDIDAAKGQAYDSYRRLMQLDVEGAISSLSRVSSRMEDLFAEPAIMILTCCRTQPRSSCYRRR